jgi:glycine/D-amino acid oxidase-like deaminating enzyme
LLSNNIPAEEVTVVLPHYAILKVGDRPSSLVDSAPPTYIAGKHSKAVELLLRSDGIVNVQRCKAVREIWVYMVQKLLWSSCLWLICHTIHKDGLPISVSEVHRHHAAQLHALVEELLPSAREIISQRVSPLIHELPTMEESLQYLQQYSLSIPNAVPSIQLARAEIEYRNQVFTANRRPDEQPLHFALLSQALGVPTALSLFDETPRTNDALMQRSCIMDLRSSIGLAVYGKRGTDRVRPEDIEVPRHVVMVGAGILGSSVAYHLARQLHDCDDLEKQSHSITVIDAACSDIHDPGPTTEASFGWINANFEKQPPFYQQLNVLGMHAWRHNPMLRALAQWNGSIVRVAVPSLELLESSSFGGYYNRAIGPLTPSELHAMEPKLNFSRADTNALPSHLTSSSFYLFPNEGSVDPSTTVISMRLAAAKLGVSFIWRHKVRRVIRSDDGTVEDVLYSPVDLADYDNIETMQANQIVIAAGIGSADIALGGLPLQSNSSIAGCIVHYENPVIADDQERTVNRVIVDMVHQYHILQRSNGTIVVGGGGFLQVGGTNATLASCQQETLSNSVSDQINKAALPLAANVQQVCMKQADRPIPLDGFPCIGYFPNGSSSQRTLYSLVSHSGITLAPILSALAATEIVHRGEWSLEVLRSFRPDRFDVELSE